MTVTSIYSLYIGITIQNILYGIELVLYFETIYMLLGNRGAYKKSNQFYALFSSVMVIFATAWVVAHTIFGENMWLVHSTYPGGAIAYWKDNIGIWYMNLAAATIIVLQLMTDALMIYRCYMIWNSYCVIIGPVVLWLATLIMGILVAWFQTTSIGSDFFTHFCLAYWSISVLLNTTLTCMICYRIVQHGKRVQQYLGQEYASWYFAVAVVIVESVLPYTLSATALLVTLGADNARVPAYICVYLLMTCISPQILILRVVTRRAWRTDMTGRQESTVQFSPGNTSEVRSQWSVGGEAQADAVRTPSSACLPNGDDNMRISEELPV